MVRLQETRSVFGEQNAGATVTDDIGTAPGARPASTGATYRAPSDALERETSRS